MRSAELISLAAIHAIRRVVKESGATSVSWQALLETCEQFHASQLWNELPTPEFQEDVLQATAWISEAALPEAQEGKAKGLYLGLDTLNMELPANTNVELGGSSDCDPANLQLEWMYHCTWYAQDHLIESLKTMKRVYDAERWSYETRDYADYALLLGYSGIVLLAAMERIDWPTDYLAVWGFHDGGIFPLVRRLNGQTERLAVPQS